MLDDERPGEVADTSTDARTPETPLSPRRRRSSRAAADPATPPGDAAPDDAPPAGRARVRRTRVAAEPPGPAAQAAGVDALEERPATAAIDGAPEAGQAEPDDVAARPARRRRAARAAAAATDELAAPAAETDAGLDAVAPVTRTRTRRARPKAADVAAAEPPAGVEPPASAGAEPPGATDTEPPSTADTEPPSTAAEPAAMGDGDQPAESRPAGRRRRAAPVVAFAPPVVDEPADLVAESRPEPSGATPPVVTFQAPEPVTQPRRRRGRTAAAQAEAAPAGAGPAETRVTPPADVAAELTAEPAAASAGTDITGGAQPDVEAEVAGAGPAIEGDAADEQAEAGRRRRRRGRRGRGRGRGSDLADDGTEATETRAADREVGDDDEGAGARAVAEDDGRPGDEAGAAAEPAEGAEAEETDEAESGEGGAGRRRRRRRRRRGDDADTASDEGSDTVVHVREPRRDARDDVRGVSGSTRLEAKRLRRREGRDHGRRRPSILSEAEFLARREAVSRVMVVRQRGDRTQIAVLEDDVLVEHYVTKASTTSYVGNVYLGKVQNVLPSMEAAFVDIGKGRNGVLYAGEVNYDAAGIEGKATRIEQALKPGQTVLVQVTKDPIGHKGARLTSQVSLPGRFLVYVPSGNMTGISRKLPDKERSRLKAILKKITPEEAGVIVRTAAEGASEEDLTRDVARLQSQWEAIEQKAGKAGTSAPSLLHAEPDLVIRVIRDVFNEDIAELVVQGDSEWDMVEQYVDHLAPDLAPRLTHWAKDEDVFSAYRVDEQLAKALDRKVWLPSGGSLIIDRTEAMVVVDVNTGKFTGKGGNLEETVTKNNLEAAEEIVRQLRLRDLGGIIVIDFIDMVLESNRELVLRRLIECLGRDRTKHQVAEVTSLGLVQMTRKRVGQGLLEAFSEPCPECAGRGVRVHLDGGAPAVPERKGKPAAEDRPHRGRAPVAAAPSPADLAGSRRPAADDAVATLDEEEPDDDELAQEVADVLDDAEERADRAQRRSGGMPRDEEESVDDDTTDEDTTDENTDEDTADEDTADEDAVDSEEHAEPTATVYGGPPAGATASGGHGRSRRRRSASRPAGPPRPPGQ